MSTTNDWCEVLGIEVPRLEAVCGHREANNYTLLLVALLESGEPMTLGGVAERFEEAGVAPAGRAFSNLKHCRPARAPIYRDGECYALDPHDDQADLWAFRLGLRPPKSRLRIVRAEAEPKPEPLPGPEVPLMEEELREVIDGWLPSGFSTRRVVTCVLDARGPVLTAEQVRAFLDTLGVQLQLGPETTKYWRKNSPVLVRDDGRLELDRGHPATVSARKALRQRLETIRRRQANRPDPEQVRASLALAQKEREITARRLARLRRVLLYSWPTRAPRALVLLDVGAREIRTLFDGEIHAAPDMLAEYEAIAAVGVRPLLESIGFVAGSRRLHELRPPQKTRRLNKSGRTLKITLDLLIRGSCGISRPFGDEKVMRGYLRDGKRTKLRRRLEADAKSLFAYYTYGRVHGAVRLRWGFLDEMLPAPWAHWSETRLYGLMKRAAERGEPLEVVTGSAPGWKDPWSRACRAHVHEARRPYLPWLEDDQGIPIELVDVQLARLPSDD